jgi:hypothetical protein
MLPSYYEKVRLAHGLPWEKLVRKKGRQHFKCPKQTDFAAILPKQSKGFVLFTRHWKLFVQLVFNWFFDGHYLAFYFLNGY